MLYKFDAVTGYCGVANPKTGFIYTYFRPDNPHQNWIDKIIKHTK